MDCHLSSRAMGMGRKSSLLSKSCKPPLEGLDLCVSAAKQYWVGRRVLHVHQIKEEIWVLGRKMQYKANYGGWRV